MRDQRTVSSQELVAMLNRLAAKGKKLTVHIPMLGMDLIEYDPTRGQITRGIKKADFAHARKKATQEPWLDSEVPTWSDLQGMMRASGVTPFGNEAEFAARMNQFEQDGLDPRQPKMAFLAADTNVLYHRLGTRHLTRLLGSEPKAIRLALSKGTYGELSAQVKHKYTSDEVSLMAKQWGHEKVVREFYNRGSLRTRRAHNGIGEYEALVRQRRAAEAPCDETSSDKEANDRLIAKSYAQFEDMHRANVLLVTGDADMQTHADSEDIQSQILEYRFHDQIPTGPLDEPRLLHFLHDLAVEFMVIEIKGTTIQLWGEWSGKRQSHWTYERLIFSYADDSLAREVVQDLEVADLIREAEAMEDAPVRLYTKPETIKLEHAASEPTKAAPDTGPTVVQVSQQEELGLSDMARLAKMRRELTIEGLAEELEMEIPGGLVQTDDCVKLALIATKLRRGGEDALADLVAQEAQGKVLATPGRQWLEEVLG